MLRLRVQKTKEEELDDLNVVINSLLASRSQLRMMHTNNPNFNHKVKKATDKLEQCTNILDNLYQEYS